MSVSPPQTSTGQRPYQCNDKGPDKGDRDAPITAPRKPTPTLDADVIAIPEPDSN
jgi:hypothetical protein